MEKEPLQDCQKTYESRNRRAVTVLFFVIATVVGSAALGVLSTSISQLLGPKSEGRVIEIIAKDVYGQRRLVGTDRERRQKHQPEVELTKFTAVVSYREPSGKAHRAELFSGEVLGHNQPPDMSKYKLGEQVTLSYNKYRPFEAAPYQPLESAKALFFFTAFSLFWAILALAFKYNRKVLARNLFVAYMILFGGGYIVLIPGCDTRSYTVTRDGVNQRIYDEDAGERL